MYVPAVFLRTHALGSVYVERSYMCSVTARSVLGTMLCKGFRNAVIPNGNEMGQCIDWTPLVSLLFWSFLNLFSFSSEIFNASLYTFLIVILIM